MEVTATDNNSEEATITVTVAVTDECQSTGEPPCAPGRPDISSASDTSLRVSWSASRTPSGTSISGYDLQYRESDSRGNWILQSVSGTDRAHTIENLIKDTTYEVQVRASNDSSGYGEWSQSGTGTAGYVPPPPTATKEGRGNDDDNDDNDDDHLHRWRWRRRRRRRVRRGRAATAAEARE